MKAQQFIFPQYLPAGSQGRAVWILQLLLKASGYNVKIVPDGDYGSETVEGVKALQADLGVDTDGNFGPETRKAYKEKTGIDINAIPSKPFILKTMVPGHG